MAAPPKRLLKHEYKFSTLQYSTVNGLSCGLYLTKKTLCNFHYVMNLVVEHVILGFHAMVPQSERDIHKFTLSV